MKQTKRRLFLKQLGATAGAALALPTIVPARVFGKESASNRITLGCIGMGGQGTQANLRAFLNQSDAQVVAVCDAYRSRAEKAGALVDQEYGAKGCKVYQDFRRIIADPDIDAVVISTPDHWHVPMSLMALAAGKDVFCEKPTLYIDEGRRLVKAVAQHQAVFQTGIEDRSTIHFHKMVEWVKNGEIGPLRRIDVTMPAGTNYPKEDPVAPPRDLDWNLWLGPAEFHPYTPNRTNGWHWRNISDYAKGAILDMGAHLVDTAQIGAFDAKVCPVEVAGTGEIPKGSETDVPITYDLTYRYANGVEISVKNGPRGGWDPQSCFLQFTGDKGWIRRKTWNAGLEASDPKILKRRYTPEATKHRPFPPGEQRNFLDSVRSRRRTTYSALDMHQISTTLHLGVIAITLGRTLNWDPQQEVVVNDAEANQLCKRPTLRDWEAQA
jgi:predicted dehydrogenase